MSMQMVPSIYGIRLEQPSKLSKFSAGWTPNYPNPPSLAGICLSEPETQCVPSTLMTKHHATAVCQVDGTMTSCHWQFVSCRHSDLVLQNYFGSPNSNILSLPPISHCIVSDQGMSCQRCTHNAKACTRPAEHLANLQSGK